MRLSAWCVALMLTGAACGGSEGTPDSGPSQNEGMPMGFTLEAVGDRSFASFGWSGTVHNITVADGTPFGVKVTSCTDKMGRCDFIGPTDPQGSTAAVKRKRCLNKTRQTCQTNNDCLNIGGTPQHAKCVYIYDNPASTPQPAVGSTSAAPKFGACGFSYIPLTDDNNAPTIVGSFDMTSGELNLQRFATQLMQNGAGQFRGVCLECQGDLVANDGKQDGTCVSMVRGAPGSQVAEPIGDNLNLRCDVHRTGNIPDFNGNYSMDCSPSVTTSDVATPFGGTFSSSGYQVALTDASPNCTDPAFANEKCFCGMCLDTPQFGCMTNADCPMGRCGGIPAGAGPTGCSPQVMPFRPTPADPNVLEPNPEFAQTPGVPPMACRTTGLSPFFAATRPNSCNGECKWDRTKGLGTCRSLLTNTDINCYPAKEAIIAPGGVKQFGNTFVVDTGHARCTGARNNPVINAQLGLPGLTFQKRSFRVIPFYP